MHYIQKKNEVKKAYTNTDINKSFLLTTTY